MANDTYCQFMVDFDSLLPDILHLQIAQWKRHPFKHKPTISKIESQIRREFPEYEKQAVEQATLEFAKRYLKERPLKDSALLNEAAIKTAARRDLGIVYDTLLQERIRTGLFQQYETVQATDSLSRSNLIDTVAAAANPIDQNLYVLWTRGEVDVALVDSSSGYEHVQLTEFGRKRHASREPNLFMLE